MDWFALFSVLLMALSVCDVEAAVSRKKIRIHVPQKVKHIHHHHKKVYITKHVGEQHEPTAFVPRYASADQYAPAYADEFDLAEGRISTSTSSSSSSGVGSSSPASSPAPNLQPLYRARGHYGPPTTTMTPSVIKIKPAKKVRVIKLSDGAKKMVLRKKPKRIIIDTTPLKDTPIKESSSSPSSSSSDPTKPKRVEKYVDKDGEHIHTYSEEHIHQVVYDDPPLDDDINDDDEDDDEDDEDVEEAMSPPLLVAPTPIYPPVLSPIGFVDMSQMGTIGSLGTPAHMEYMHYEPQHASHDHMVHEHGEFDHRFPDAFRFADVPKNSYRVPGVVRLNPYEQQHKTKPKRPHQKHHDDDDDERDDRRHKGNKWAAAAEPAKEATKVKIHIHNPKPKPKSKSKPKPKPIKWHQPLHISPISSISPLASISPLSPISSVSPIKDFDFPLSGGWREDKPSIKGNKWSTHESKPNSYSSIVKWESSPTAAAAVTESPVRSHHHKHFAKTKWGAQETKASEHDLAYYEHFYPKLHHHGLLAEQSKPAPVPAPIPPPPRKRPVVHHYDEDEEEVEQFKSKPKYKPQVSHPKPSPIKSLRQHHYHKVAENKPYTTASTIYESHYPVYPVVKERPKKQHQQQQHHREEKAESSPYKHYTSIYGSPKQPGFVDPLQAYASAHTEYRHEADPTVASWLKGKGGAGAKKASISTQNINFGGQEHKMTINHETHEASESRSSRDSDSYVQESSPQPIAITYSPVESYYNNMGVKAVEEDSNNNKDQGFIIVAPPMTMSVGETKLAPIMVQELPTMGREHSPMGREHSSMGRDHHHHMETSTMSTTHAPLTTAAPPPKAAAKKSKKSKLDKKQQQHQGHKGQGQQERPNKGQEAANQGQEDDARMSRGKFKYGDRLNERYDYEYEDFVFV